MSPKPPKPKVSDRFARDGANNVMITQLRQKIAELERGALPIMSHHCQTTHTACDCILSRMNKLRVIADATKALVDGPKDSFDHEQIIRNLRLSLKDAGYLR